MQCEYLIPKSIDEACSMLSEYKNEGKILAGGQSLLILLKHRLLSPEYLIDIKGLSELDYIKAEGDVIKIGGLTTHRALESSSLLKEKYPVIAEMEEMLGTVQIRNWGTVGGSLCHGDPASDEAPVLLALGTKVRVKSVRGEREIDLNDFLSSYYETMLDPDEILVEITVPLPRANTGGAYRKESVRVGDLGIAAVATVVSLDKSKKVIEDAHIVLGGVGARAIVAPEAQNLLVGKEIGNGIVEQVAGVAAGESEPVSDLRSSADYRREMVRILTRDMVKAAIRRAQAV